MDLKNIPVSSTENLNINENMAAAKIAGGSILVGAYGLTLSDWVAIATILYMILQIGLLLPKYWALISRWKKS